VFSHTFGRSNQLSFQPIQNVELRKFHGTHFGVLRTLHVVGLHIPALRLALGGCVWMVSYQDRLALVSPPSPLLAWNEN
jgi:Na+-transporting NADH:ubiquinone oxidoreductase subunit NqrA